MTRSWVRWVFGQQETEALSPTASKELRTVNTRWVSLEQILPNSSLKIRLQPLERPWDRGTQLRFLSLIFLNFWLFLVCFLFYFGTRASHSCCLSHSAGFLTCRDWEINKLWGNLLYSNRELIYPGYSKCHFNKILRRWVLMCKHLIRKHLPQTQSLFLFICIFLLQFEKARM